MTNVSKNELNNEMLLMIAETSTSMWNYHLREVLPGQEKYSGGAGPALCGRPLGWDTKIPLTAWGNYGDGHIPESYCKECERIAIENGLKK